MQLHRPFKLRLSDGRSEAKNLEVPQAPAPGAPQGGVDADAGLSPLLVAEIAASSASYDLHSKLEVYERGGVREYVVWRTYDSEVDWFELRDGAFKRLEPDEDGLFRSKVFPGLWLDVAALLRGDMKTVLEVLERGIASPDHERFVESLGGTTE